MQLLIIKILLTATLCVPVKKGSESLSNGPPHLICYVHEVHPMIANLSEYTGGTHLKVISPMDCRLQFTIPFSLHEIYRTRQIVRGRLDFKSIRLLH